ncbi:MAG: Hsp20/alpha crystallin family protein [Oscillospiraceae bacterium]|nr:Hsp20/alpha crystallin family protein [Oscillospiraceae bacterium]
MFEIIPFERRRNQVANWDPSREFDEMERRFWGDRGMQSAFRTDITDTGDAYKLEAELPGFRKEDIKIDIEDGRLTISAEHSTDEKNEKDNYVRRERYYGSYSRSFDITGIDEEVIGAEYKDGILVLNMPKKAPEQPKARRLEIQ